MPKPTLNFICCTFCFRGESYKMRGIAVREGYDLLHVIGENKILYFPKEIEPVSFETQPQYGCVTLPFGG